MSRRRRNLRDDYVLISTVAERYEIHPQTLRLYEREGLLHPVRSSGNTRLYDEISIRRLEVILFLTREMGVNLAGVEVLLTFVDQLGQPNISLRTLLDLVQSRVEERKTKGAEAYAIVKWEG